MFMSEGGKTKLPMESGGNFCWDRGDAEDRTSTKSRAVENI